VEIEVVVREAVDVTSLDAGQRPLGQRPQLGDLISLGPLRGPAGGVRLERISHLVGTPDGELRQLHHPSPAPAVGLDHADVLQPQQGLAHGRLADSQLLGQGCLGHRASRCKAPVDDPRRIAS
jgi:hypothetical protein